MLKFSMDLCYQIRTIIWYKAFESPRISSHLGNQVVKYGDKAESFFPYPHNHKAKIWMRSGVQMVGYIVVS